MNKKLLALAIGAAVAMPVSALAAGPTLYGQIDLSVENVDVDGDATPNPPDFTGVTVIDPEVGTTDNTWVLRNNKSRIGVRGDADTSVAGLKGIYQAEFGVDADDGGDISGELISDRDIFVGLAGGFGTAKMGNFDTPVKKSQGKIDQFNDSTLDIERYVAGETRADNIVQYSSPLIADLVTVNVAMTTEDDGNGTGNSASVVYDKDGLYLALAFDNNMASDSDGVDMGSVAEVDILRLTAGYTVDALEFGFLYQTAESGEQVDNGAEDTSLVLSGALTAGSWKFKAQYGQTDGDNADETLSSLALGADYALGKSTTVYALAGIEELKEAEDNRGVVGFGLRQMF